MAAKIKTGDMVQVLSGRDSGKRGDVVSVNPKTNKAIVRGSNMVTRHMRPRMGQEGGKVEKEMPINLSNLALIDPADDKPTRVGFKLDEAGNKVRYAKRSGEMIDKG